ncbi:hypothetical protein TIFTF001_021193 [Ficus carica]|uniref:Uncharacterized protein n=1 Tax=Ficus carica TaxID=3494 RepID=A0AA88AG88_FICCA|nr:hypothetical protein TIFTF001_021193 [Ficus carica]
MEEKPSSNLNQSENIERDSVLTESSATSDTANANKVSNLPATVDTRWWSVAGRYKWLPRWTWDMLEHKEIAVMISLCGVEERNREKAERTLMVALWCIQHSPEARPSMNNVVQMLEGSKEVTPPPCPFEHRQSPGPIFGNDDESSNTYTSPSAIRKIHSNRVHNTFEIELAVD